MSEVRRVRYKIEADLFRRTARDLGWELQQNAPVRGFFSQEIIADLVATPPSTNASIGYLKKEEKLVFDNVYSNYATQFLTHYFEKSLETRGIRYRRMENEKEVIYEVY